MLDELKYQLSHFIITCNTKYVYVTVKNVSRNVMVDCDNICKDVGT